MLEGKLSALFSLGVDCVVGNRHLSDYTKLQSQYPIFNLPNNIRTKFDNLGSAAIAGRVTVKGGNNTELETLMQGQDCKLEKPRSVRVGEKFDCKD